MVKICKGRQRYAMAYLSNRSSSWRYLFCIYYISFAAGELFYEFNAVDAHRECGGGKTVGVMDVRADHGKAHDAVHGLIACARVIDMLAADVCAGGGHAFVAHAQYFYIFILLERIFYPHRPLFAIRVISVRLDIAARVDIKILKLFFLKELCGIPNCPALHKTGRIIASRPVF